MSFLLSNILKDMAFDGPYRISNEKQFKFMALIASDLSQSNCIFLDSPKYVKDVKDTVTMILITEELASLITNKNVGICVVSNPRQLFFDIHNYLCNIEGYFRETFNTEIGVGCNISKLSSIAEKNVLIGHNVQIEEFVVIRENTIVGDNSIIRSGCNIGGQGFEFKRNGATGISSVTHLGGVKIGENVEIQYNTCVDKGIYPWDDTIIGDNCKIDNLVHIAHGVKLGKNVMVVANAGIGGRVIVKDGTWIGFAATIINGVSIGEKARANIGAVVTKSIPDFGNVTGNFAIEHHQFINNLKKSIEDEAE